MLKNLCKEYTDLNQQELDKLARLEEMLPLIADLMNADVFIDCLTRDPDVAVVAAEAKPKSHPSLYQGSVAGQLALRKNEPAALRTLEIGMETRDLKALTQEQIMVKQSVVPIKFGEKVIGALIMEQDVTNAMNQNARMEILSETAEQLTQTLMNFQEGDVENPITHHLNDAILVFDQDGLSTYANPVAEELYRKLGYLDRITGMHFDNLSLNETKFRNILENQNLAVSEINIGGLTLQVKYARMRIGGNQKGIIMLIRDVTEVKEKEKELILKSVAIREIHHRVKNNLQTIASLLRLQSRRLNDQESKIFFQESINRVLSMAATHEILAQNGVDDVDIMTLLLKLKASTFNFESRPDGKIQLTITGDRFVLNSEKATSIALVVYELIQNSMKHAFPNREEGRICVIIQKGILYSNISIIDNGAGFHVSHTGSGLGLNIVKDIVRDKLHGNFGIESGENGTKVVFDFQN